MKITLKSLTTDAIYPNMVVKQHGLSTDLLKSKLEQLAQIVNKGLVGLDSSIKFRVTSGFRLSKKSDKGLSQHEVGEALDLQVNGVASASVDQYEQTVNIANHLWNNPDIRPHINQLILEKVKGFVLHIGIKANSSEAKNEFFTLVYATDGKKSQRLANKGIASYSSIVQTQVSLA